MTVPGPRQIAGSDNHWLQDSVTVTGQGIKVTAGSQSRQQQLLPRPSGGTITMAVPSGGTTMAVGTRASLGLSKAGRNLKLIAILGMSATLGQSVAGTGLGITGRKQSLILLTAAVVTVLA